MTTVEFKTREPSATGWCFDNSYVRLPGVLYTRTNPVPVAKPQIIIFNDLLSDSLGLDTTNLAAEGLEVFSGNLVPQGAQPIAQAYAGHQFGHFTMLGDGRVVLLGEQVTPGGERFDIQLKGAGPTAYSRRGDGRAALGPMLREYVMSEALYALGISTTRSLAVAVTGEPVFRETMFPGAVLTRVAQSHIRVGTFEFVAAQKEYSLLQVMADYTIRRHYPELVGLENSYALFLRAVIDRQASLVAKWLLVGFIHGVMNTDNMALSGETIDYGPCAFMDQYDPATVFSSIDVQGRYSYGNQPFIAQWNLTRFAETLLPLLDTSVDEAVKLAENELRTFSGRFRHYWTDGMLGKLGLNSEEGEDSGLIERLLEYLKENRLDYTNTFRALSHGRLPDGPEFQTPMFVEWYSQWQERLGQQERVLDEVYAGMRMRNPAVIPRNYRVEEALTAAVDNDDLSVLQGLLRVLKTPFSEPSDSARYCSPPQGGGAGYRTFCGT
jgi:uncharacterized protein YdiU (UPF0061 family)